MPTAYILERSLKITNYDCDSLDELHVADDCVDYLSGGYNLWLTVKLYHNFDTDYIIRATT